MRFPGNVANRRRNILPNQRLKVRFEPHLPPNLGLSSHDLIWKLRFEIKAGGAADYMQELPLTIS